MIANEYPLLSKNTLHNNHVNRFIINNYQKGKISGSEMRDLSSTSGILQAKRLSCINKETQLRSLLALKIIIIIKVPQKKKKNLAAGRVPIN